MFLDDEYSLIGIAKGFLPSPEIFGMVPEMLHTACYRGYYCTYELTSEQLLLKELTLKEVEGNYLPIDGVEPVDDDGAQTYKGLHHRVPFTGKLRLAKDFIEELYIHMGYQKASAFRTVLDCTFADGRVTCIHDRSDEMEKKRGEFKKKYGSSNCTDAVDDAFSLDMDLE